MTKRLIEHHNHHVLLLLDQSVQAIKKKIYIENDQIDFFTGKYGRQPASRVFAI